MFERCDFLLGAGNSVIIVIPLDLPKAETYTVSISSENIRFKADYDDVVAFPYKSREVFQRIANNTQVGLVVYNGIGAFPSIITHVAYVEVRRAME